MNLKTLAISFTLATCMLGVSSAGVAQKLSCTASPDKVTQILKNAQQTEIMSGIDSTGHLMQIHHNPQKGTWSLTQEQANKEVKCIGASGQQLFFGTDEGYAKKFSTHIIQNILRDDQTTLFLYGTNIRQVASQAIVTEYTFVFINPETNTFTVTTQAPKPNVIIIARGDIININKTSVISVGREPSI